MCFTESLTRVSPLTESWTRVSPFTESGTRVSPFTESWTRVSPHTESWTRVSFIHSLESRLCESFYQVRLTCGCPVTSLVT